MRELKLAAKIRNAREMKTCLRLMVLVQQNVFCYHPSMQSFDTDTDDALPSPGRTQSLVVGELDDLSPGTCVRFELPGGEELAVFNVSGEFYAIENSCPHRGAPLSEGTVCGHVVECGFAVRIEDRQVVVEVNPSHG